MSEGSLTKNLARSAAENAHLAEGATNDPALKHLATAVMNLADAIGCLSEDLDAK